MIRKLTLDDVSVTPGEIPAETEAGVRGLLAAWVPRGADGNCDFYALGDKIGKTIDDVIDAGGLINYVPKTAARYLAGDALTVAKGKPVAHIMLGLLNAVSEKDWCQQLLQGLLNKG